ncbi:MAG TPA: TPM domain-containing protein, partial [Pyrinomonadaceae bacterium]|nr:TPM domain-containing protein [Pyrinomonadaceae bacterium]
MIAALILKHRTFVVLAALALACLLSWAAEPCAAQTTESPVPMPNPPTPVVDTANVLDAATKQRLEDMLKNLSEDKTANMEMGVVTVNTTGGRDIFDYSLAVMRGWGIGLGEKGGLLLLIAVQDRKYYTQVSRHLEGDLPDSVVGEIQRRYLVPAFRAGDYNKGVMDTVQAFLATLAEKRGFSVEGLDRSYAYRRTGQQPSRGTGNRRGGTSGCTMFFIILIIVVFLLASRGRGGGGGGGCLNMLLLGSLLNSGGRGSSGWSGGGFGGGSG